MKKDLNSTKEQLSLELNDLRNKSKEREEMQEAANQQLLATEQQLRAANQQLAANNQQLLATEQQLQTSNQQLKERLKELDCLYGISKIVEIPDISLEEIFRRTVKLIPDSWQYPEITVCRIILEGIEYKTHNFNKTKWSQSSDIIIDGKHIGNIEVCYLKEMPDFDEGSFLKEERLLLDALAERLGRITERVLGEEKQRAVNQQLRAANQQLDASNQQLSANEQQLVISEAKYKRISENTPAVVYQFEMTPEGAFTFPYINDSAKTILGVNAEDIINDSSILISKVHPDDQQMFLNGVMKSAKTFDTYHETFRYLKNGKVIWLECRTSPNLMNNGNILWDGFLVDITKRKQVEEALWQSEATIRNKLKAIMEPNGDIGALELSEIIDTQALKSIMENFHKLTGITGAVLDVTGKVLVAVGWQDICTKFHRCNPETLKNCLESDTILTRGVEEGDFKSYRCKNNLWDIVTPIIVGRKHLGNVFMGQYMLEGKEQDIELFRQQAQKYGFDEEEYLAALHSVPHFSEDTIREGIQFYSQLAKLISHLSFSTIQQSRMLSERKEAERKLKESEERLRLSTNIAGIAVWEYDFIANKMERSTNHDQLYGLKPKDIYTYETFLNTIHPDDRERCNAILIESFEPGGSDQYEFDYRVIWPDKSVHWLWIFGEVTEKDEKGKASFIRGCLMDITERKQIEESLRESREKLYLTIDNSPLGVCSNDLKGNFISTNQTYERMLGYSKDELKKLNFFDITHPDDRPDNRSLFNKMTSAKKTGFAMEKRYIRKDGSIINVFVHAGVIRNTKGNPAYGLAFVEDITKRKKAKEALLQSEQKFQNQANFLDVVIDNSPFTMWVSDEKGTLIRSNQALRNILNVSDDMIIGKYNVLNDNNLKEQGFMPDVEAVFNDLKSSRFDMFWQGSKAGDVDLSQTNKLWIDVSFHPILDETGKLVNVICQYVDITKRKKAEEKLIESEKQLLQAQFIAKIGDFTWNIQTGKVSWSDGMHKLLKYDKDEKIDYTKVNKDIHHPDDLERVTKWLMDNIASGNKNLEPNEYRLVCKNGEIKYVQSNGTIEYKNDKAVQLFGTCIDITERKLAEEALRKSEKRLSLIYNSTSDNMVLIKVENPSTYRIVSFNDEYFRSVRSIYGEVSKEQLLNHTPKELKELFDWTDSLYDNTIRNYLKVIETAKPIKTVDELPTPNTTLFFETVFIPVFNNEKICTHILYTSRDITDRKKAEEALQKNKQKYESLILNSPDLLMIQGTDGFLKYISPQCENILGYTTEEIKNIDYQKLVHTDDLETANVKRKSTLDGSELSNFEYRFFKKNGDIVWLDHTARSIIIDKTTTEIISTVRDITERKRNEQIQKIIHNISNAVAISNNPTEFLILVKNELGAIIDTSNFYIATYNNTEDSISILFHKDKKDELRSFPSGKTLTNYVIKTKKSLLATKEVIANLEKSGEVELLGSDSEVWLGVPLFAKSKVSGVLVVQSYENEKAYDLADMRVLEFVSHQISISLERKKAEEELKSALEKAQESDRLKSAFLTNMSHEIRTPMNGILGFTGLLKDPQLTGDEKEDYIQVIEKSGDRMLNTITDIIDISRIESGQVEVVNTEVSLNNILNEQYEIFNPDAQSKGLELNYKPTLSDKGAIIVTDIHKLVGILTNLIKNAIKFTKHGNISFGYSLNKEKDFEGLEFFIKDTGIGIPSNRISAIFNRFEQADIEDTQVFEGSGLGLAISKSYVEMLGGEISVTSEEGIGSTFVFSIPYTKPTIKERDVESDINKIPEVSLNKLSAIVAEDDEISRMLLEAILENEFHKIIYTKTGKETVDKFRENPETSIILMDLKMHDMSGYEATREIRKFNQDVVIIAQTAYGLSNDKEKAIEAGCDDYISKPFKKELLFEKIMLHLSKRSI